MFRYLLDSVSSPKGSASFLVGAANLGLHQVVKSLLKMKVNPSQLSYLRGEFQASVSPLHVAAGHGHMPILELLLDLEVLLFLQFIFRGSTGLIFSSST